MVPQVPGLVATKPEVLVVDDSKAQLEVEIM
jgi:hypothetical protein